MSANTLITLSEGKAYALVDAEDFDYLNQWKWKYRDGRALRFKSWKKPGTHWKDDKRNYRVILMHRLILNAPDGMEVDHRNHNQLDNRKSNLRLCTHHQNTMNKQSAKSSSGYKGVYWDKRKAKWYTQISFMGKSYTLALFESPIEAAKEYDYVAKQLYGDFANLNFGGSRG